MATIGLDRSSLRGAGLVLVLVTMPLLSGCASFPRLVKPPVEPPASEAVSFFETGGVRLYSATWLPEGDPVGVIYFVVGAEVGSAEPYPTFAAAAHAAGFALATVHARGSGYSDGPRGDLEDYRLFLADLSEGLERLRERFPSKPIFLFGHSAGAALALELAATSGTRPAGLVLVNPAYKVVYREGMGPSWSDYPVYAFNYVFRASALTVDMNSRPSAIEDAAERAEAEAMQRDPLVVRYFSLRFLSAQKKVMDACVTNAKATQAPMLLVQGAHDVLVDPTGNDEILAAAATTDKVKLLAANGGHGSSSVETMVTELLQWLRRIV